MPTAVESLAIAFTVFGKPEPAGSKRAFAIRKGGMPTGQIAVSDANPKAKSWQREVRDAAREVLDGLHPDNPARYLGSAPVGVSMVFYVRRPLGHYGTGRNADKLKPSAPPYPASKPDVLKLARGTEDAMTGIVYRDDAQVVNLVASKRYGLPERCEIVVLPADLSDSDSAAIIQSMPSTSEERA